MVEIDVGVAGGVYEFSWFQAADLRHHHREESVGCDVERNPEESVGTSLIELAGQFPFCDIELEKTVAGREGHLADLCGIPCGNYDPAGVRIVLYKVQGIGYLVDGSSVRGGPGPPLMAVNRAEVSVLISPFVPNRHSMVLQVLDVCVPGKEPKKLVDYGFKMDLLRRQERKALAQVEPHLMAENALCPDSGAVMADDTFSADPLQKVKILFHRAISLKMQRL